MKSFKHEHLFHLHSYIVTLTPQTYLGLRYRTFTQNINKLITFSEITQAWQCYKILLYDQMSSHTEFQL